jgi:hypothetical protein
MILAPPKKILRALDICLKGVSYGKAKLPPMAEIATSIHNLCAGQFATASSAYTTSKGLV